MLDLDRDAYLDALAREGGALITAAAARLDAPVPACPDWDGAGLLAHVGEVHSFWRWIVEGARTSPDGYEPPARPAAGDLAGWCRGELDALHRVLEATDPATPVWTWTPRRDAAFVVRRMAQETAVHRWDAESTAGAEAASPIEPALAADGVDEFLEYFLPALAPVADPGGSAHLHATDTPGEWLVRVEAGAPVVERAHAKGDVAVRAPASDLLLLLWRRRTAGGLEVFGDAAVLERLLGASRTG